MAVLKLDSVPLPNTPAIVALAGTRGKASICHKAPVPPVPVVSGTPGPQLVYLNNVLAALVPLGVVIKTLTSPAACAGVVAVKDVSDTTVILVAAVPPKLTAVAPVKLLPVNVTAVPPTVTP